MKKEEIQQALEWVEGLSTVNEEIDFDIRQTLIECCKHALTLDKIRTENRMHFEENMA